MNSHNDEHDDIDINSNERHFRAPLIDRSHFVKEDDIIEAVELPEDNKWSQLEARFPVRLTLLFFAAQLIYEVILRLNVDGQFLTVGLFYLSLFCLIRSVFFAAVISILPARVKSRAIFFLLVLLPVIYASQLIYYKFFRTFFVFYSVGEGGQILQFLEDIIVKVLRNLPWIILLFIPLIVWRVYLKEKISAMYQKMIKGWRVWLTAGMIMFLLFGSTVGIMAFNRSFNSPWEHYFLENEILTGTNQFGLLTAMGVDISHLIYPRSAIIQNDLIPDPIDPPKPIKPTIPDPSSDPTESEAPPPVIRYPNILPIDFEARLLNDGVDDGSLPVLMGKSRADLVSYLDLVFSRTQPSYTNDHTGRGEGFNLIFVTAESFSKYCIDEELTPTLWMMYHEGVHFENFYVPVWTVSTLDGEYAGLCGMIPKQGVWTLKEAHKNDMAMVPGNMFRRLGYTTYAWHNHTWNYYSRDLSHPNLGYDYRGLGHGLSVVPTWPESDLEMIEKTAFEFVNQEPFHVYYLTVSGHANWTKNGNAMSTKHWDTFSHLDLPHEGIAYLAANYELELAMTSLLKQLRDAGIAERTLIVINPDHYPYALEEHSSYEALAGKKLDKEFDIYESCALFYHDGIEPEVVDKYATSLDLLPTIYNYMGVPYDSRFFSGRDIFSDSEAIAIFLGRSWITEEGRYNALTATFTPHPGRELEDQEEYVDRINREVKLRYDTARVVIDSDYYRDLLTDEEWAEINEPYIRYMEELPWLSPTSP
ncbi:MAG: sulfatase-like hydrolase/transferase [Clostridiaceae bacterium]|nr:sulfatase-like hydrolase/transferase [Eubacteriales bacterium]MDD3417953.1 sulfatase-like hydrolase/transferase [Eubacteriales bacterium]MDD4186377.1 sulfatase-like hydrolase/transferase [Eubacteriales bacterium]NLG30428.1 sulfatase-like hydrolase/transferase [Clostridiaceae bacterium]